MTVMTDRIPHARIVTPTVTFQKHEFVLDSEQAYVRRGPDVKATMVLTEEVGTYGSGTYRLVGLVDGEPQIWRVDNQGCGCGFAVRTDPTQPEDVPT